MTTAQKFFDEKFCAAAPRAASDTRRTRAKG
jgi:hypothetical protein